MRERLNLFQTSYIIITCSYIEEKSSVASWALSERLYSLNISTTVTILGKSSRNQQQSLGTGRDMQFTKNGEMSLSEATKPLLVVSRLVGINPKSHWHKMYTGLILTCDLSLMCYAWQFHTRRNFNHYYFHILVNVLQDVCFVTSIFFIWGFSLFDRKRFMFPLRDFATVDESLKNLGGCIDNRGVYRLEIIQIIFVGLIPVVFWLSEFSCHISAVTEEQLYAMLLLGLFYHLTILIACAIVDCSFSMNLSVIRRRFKEINSIIRRLGTQEFHLRRNVLEVSRARTDDDVFRALKILRNQYHDLWEIANKVNDAYGLHLLAGMVSSLAIITSKLYEAYSAFVDPDRSSLYAIGSTNWVLFYVIRIFILAQACESTVSEAKATSVTLHNLRMTRDHSSVVKEEIRDFFTQLQFDTRNFTAYNFFNVDFSLVCSILAAACTYLVILIQMGESTATVITGDLNESFHFGSECQT